MAVRIKFPEYDIGGQPRPRRMPPLTINTKYFRRIITTIQRRRRREPELADALDAMDRDLWRQANRALGHATREAPSRDGWRRVFREAPLIEGLARRASRADKRRRALALQGLAKSLQTQRPLAVRESEPLIQFGRRRWASPVPRGPPRHWRFSPYRLDYYQNQSVPVDPRDWIPAPLYKRLLQRGRTRRSPQAVPRRRPI
jgi:hypothetical protein